MSLFSFNHLHLICMNLDVMIEFWTEALGGRLLERRRFGTADGASLDFDGIRIYIRLPKTGENMKERGEEMFLGYDHVGLISADFDSAIKRLTGYGCRLVADPVSRGGRKTVFLRGPENILIELKNGK